MDWLNVAAGVITVITGVITIAQAVKRKQPVGPPPAGSSTDAGKRTGRTGGPPPKAIKPSIAPAVAGVQEFSGDDRAYQEWVTNHPQGFVVNTNQRGNPAYMALHRATCRHISNFDTREQGAFTERDLMKVCSTEVDRLKEWAKAHGRKDGSFTGKCPCTSS